MRLYLRILSYLKPYWSRIMMSVICMVLFSFLSSFSIWMVAPFLNTLFGDQGAPEVFVEDDFSIQASSSTRPEGTTLEETQSSILKKITSLEDLREELKRMMERYLLQGTKVQALRRLCIVFFVMFFLKNIFGYFQAYFMAFIEQRIIKDLMDGLYMHMHRLSLRYFEKRRAGQLISRVTNDVQIAVKAINVSFTNLVRDPLLIFLYLGMAIIISWKLTLMAFAVLPLSLLIVVTIGKRLRRISTRRQEKMADITSILQETVTGIRVVKAFAMEKFEIGKFLKESQIYFKNLFGIARMQKLVSPITEQLSVLIGLFILWYGGMQVLDERMISAEFFILFLACIFSMIRPIKELSSANNGIQEGMAAAERIFRVLDTTPEVQDGKTSVEMTSAQGVIQFKDVSFSYYEGEPVLKHINLMVKPGEVIALVGPSGAGKSTLVDLIPRFYDPVEGSVHIDDVDIREIRLDSLRNLMGIVTQEVILFNDTVRNNIAYGLQEIPTEKVIEAAKAANAHDFILEMPESYDTSIGDRGVKLSGGERQRISIARAILKNPPILIFDEATSSLDTESEILVQQAIDNLMKGRTTIVIAHRLSTVQNADRILVLSQGKIVQEGTHRELLVQEGLYKTLYEMQFRS